MQRQRQTAVTAGSRDGDKGRNARFMKNQRILYNGDFHGGNHMSTQLPERRDTDTSGKRAERGSGLKGRVGSGPEGKPWSSPHS